MNKILFTQMGSIRPTNLQDINFMDGQPTIKYEHVGRAAPKFFILL